MSKKIFAFLTVIFGVVILLYFELLFDEHLRFRILGDLVGVLLIVIGFIRFNRQKRSLQDEETL